MKYTDEQIKKALKLCQTVECTKECPLYEADCISADALEKHALDLINRQEAEIERLKAENEQLGNDVDRKLKYIYELEAKIENHKDECLTIYARGLYEGETEAIKELMFNLKGDISAYSNAGHDLDVYAWLQNYAKEMVGESK